LAISVPSVDPHKICQDSRNAALPEDKANAYDSCVHDEQAAREQLQQKWTQFSATARATCVEPQASMTSYVEMLTCLEMESGGNFATGKIPAPDVAAPSPANPPAPNAARQKP